MAKKSPVSLKSQVIFQSQYQINGPNLSDIYDLWLISYEWKAKLETS